MMLYHPLLQELKIFDKLVKSKDTKILGQLKIRYSLFTLFRDIQLHKGDFLILLNDKHPIHPQLISSLLQLGLSIVGLIHHLNQFLLKLGTPDFCRLGP